MKLGSLTVKNQRSCTIGDYENESGMVDVTWATLVTDFSMMEITTPQKRSFVFTGLQQKNVVGAKPFCELH